MLLFFSQQGSSTPGTPTAASATITVLTKSDGILRRGDDEVLEASITPYTAASGQLFFMAKRRKFNADADAILNLSLNSGITITDAGTVSTPAIAQIAVPSASTKALPNRTIKLFYELTDGANHTLVSDDFTVAPEVRQT